MSSGGFGGRWLPGHANVMQKSDRDTSCPFRARLIAVEDVRVSRPVTEKAWAVREFWICEQVVKVMEA